MGWGLGAGMLKPLHEIQTLFRTNGRFSPTGPSRSSAGHMLAFPPHRTAPGHFLTTGREQRISFQAFSVNAKYEAWRAKF